MGVTEREEQWKSRALYEEEEKLRMEQRLADLLRNTGRWVVQRAGDMK